MKKAIFAVVMALAIFAVSATINTAPDENFIDKKKVEIPPNG
ncbi:MAG: hypothetical protein ACI828_000497 [Flavobacteriales bacterium]|jgi:hypothetical protein